MMLIKNKLFVVFGAAVLLTATGYSVFSANKNKDLGHDIDVTLINAGQFRGYTENIKQGILVIERRLKLETPLPVEKLDFSLDVNEQNGTDPRYKIFSPEGGRVFLIDHLKELEYWGKYVKGDHLIFTLGNRVRGAGSDQSELIVVFPEVTDVMCRVINKSVGVEDGNSSGIPEVPKLNLIPHPQISKDKDIVDLQWPSACITLPDGKNYYYEVLVGR